MHLWVCVCVCVWLWRFHRIEIWQEPGDGCHNTEVKIYDIVTAVNNLFWKPVVCDYSTVVFLFSPVSVDVAALEWKRKMAKLHKQTHL